MQLNSRDAIQDLEQYVKSLRFSLSEAVKRIFLEVEKISEAIDNPPAPLGIFLLAAIKMIPRLQNTVNELGGNAVKAMQLLYRDAQEGRDELDHYGSETHPYSTKEHREVLTRTIVVDLCLASARRNQRRQVFDMDFIEVIIQCHEEASPVINNISWIDERLHTPFNTLSHILGRYSESLWIKFDNLRAHLELASPSLLQKSPVESAPAYIRSALLHLFQDYPDYEKNCFLVMPFTATRLYEEIHVMIKNTLSKLGFKGLRADDHAYADDLFTNVETYLYGCSFAIAVFERLSSDVYNPNVSFEVGYLIGLGKPVCLLKEKTLPRLPTDLVGKLYREFDIQDIANTIPQQIEKWMREKKLLV